MIDRLADKFIELSKYKALWITLIFAACFVNSIAIGWLAGFAIVIAFLSGISYVCWIIHDIEALKLDKAKEKKNDTTH